MNYWRQLGLLGMVSGYPSHLNSGDDSLGCEALAAPRCVAVQGRHGWECVRRWLEAHQDKTLLLYSKAVRQGHCRDQSGGLRTQQTHRIPAKHLDTDLLERHRCELREHWLPVVLIMLHIQVVLSFGIGMIWKVLSLGVRPEWPCLADLSVDALDLGLHAATGRLQ